MAASESEKLENREADRFVSGTPSLDLTEFPELEAEALGAELREVADAQPQASGLLHRWTPILVKFASVQVVVQLLGFAAGILVIRNLPKREYAFYTLCNTMLATILVLADSGISSALTAIGGRVWQDREQLSRLMNTALRLRRMFVLLALPVVIPVLVWLMLQNGAQPSRLVVLVGAVLLGCGLELITRIYTAALRLMAEIKQIQKQALIGAAVKAAIVAVAVVTWFNVEIAVFAVVAGFAVQYWMLHRWVAGNLDPHAGHSPAMRSEILSVVKRQAPHSIHYCLQSQITIWLISIFGNADGVANIGALSRLAALFAIVSSITTEILFPAFAREQDPQKVRAKYWQILCGLAGIMGSIVLIVAIFPGQVLAVLGSQYSHLHSEGVLLAVSTVIGAITGVAWGLNAARAWIIPPATFVPLSILIQAVLIYFFKLSTVQGVLLFSIFSTIPSFIWATAFAMRCIHRLEESPA